MDMRAIKLKIEPMEYMIPTAFSFVILFKKLELVYAGIAEVKAKMNPNTYKTKRVDFLKFNKLIFIFLFYH